MLFCFELDFLWIIYSELRESTTLLKSSDYISKFKASDFLKRFKLCYFSVNSESVFDYPTFLDYS